MKKTIAIVLMLALILSMLTVPSFAGTGEMITGSTYGYQYYYSDSYFSADASEYNPSLATMSLHLTTAGIANGSDNWSHQYNELFRVFKNLGFTDREVNSDFEKEPTTDSMGVGVAHKTIDVNGKEYTLLVVVPRMNYMAEWASNFTLGVYGEASGFSTSAGIVEDFLDDYIAEYGSSFAPNLKLWIAGYSRGAAVANLVAGHISEAGEISGIPVNVEDVYAYTFETPKGANISEISMEEAKSFTNIHNIVTSNDLVTKLAPEEWGFLRYGTDESVIPEIRTAENGDLFETALSYLPEYLAAYNDEGQRVFATELFQAKRFSLSAEDHRADYDKSMSESLDDLFKAAATGVGSRASYTLLIQDSIRLLMSETFGGSYQTEIWESLKTGLKEELQEKADEMLTLACTGREYELTVLLNGIVEDAIAESGLDVKAYGALPLQLTSMIPIFVSVIMADVVIDNGSDILSFIDNLDILFNPHFVEQLASWLMAQDKNYNPAAEAVSGAVSGVKVNVSKLTTTKKILFTKLSITSYKTDIVPIVNGSVRKVEYSKLPVGIMTEGASFTQDIKPAYLYIDVTDVNGNVTHWEYKSGTVTQVN